MNFPNKRLAYALGFVVMLATWLLYFRVVDFAFIQYDDPKHIFENFRMMDPSWANISEYWARPFFALYIPMTYTVWSWVAALTGNPLKPGNFHALNLFLHIANSAMLYTLLVAFLNFRGTRKKIRGIDASLIPWAAATGALFFAWHPLGVEAVSWISCTKDVLCTFFCLLSSILYFAPRALKGKVSGTPYWVGAFVVYLCAVLSKPLAIMLPFALFIVETVLLDEQRKISARRLAPWLLVIPVIGWLTKLEQPTATIPNLTALWGRPLVMLDAIGFYLQKLILPISLSVDYGRSPTEAFRAGLWWHVMLVVTLATALIWKAPRHIATVCLGLFALFLLPVSGLIPFSFQQFSTVADRYAYLPLACMAPLVAFLFLKIKDSTLRALYAFPLIVLCAVSSLQVETWRSSDAVFSHALKKRPDSLVINTNYTFDLIERKEFEKALVHAKKAAELAPTSSEHLANIGAVYGSTNDLQNASFYFDKALAMDPKNTTALFNYSTLYLRNNQPAKALEKIKILEAVRPGHPVVRQLAHDAESQIAAAKKK